MLNFLTFRNGFCVAIHEAVNLTNVQKFQYSRANLKGKALRPVDGQALTDANYDKAMSLLKTRYSKQHKLISAYNYEGLWEIPKSNVGAKRGYSTPQCVYCKGSHTSTT